MSPFFYRNDITTQGNHKGVQPTTIFFWRFPKIFLCSVHPETTLKIPKLKLWTPNNGHLGVQSFSFGSVSGWTLCSRVGNISISFQAFYSSLRNRVFSKNSIRGFSFFVKKTKTSNSKYQIIICASVLSISYVG